MSVFPTATAIQDYLKWLADIAPAIPDPDLARQLIERSSQERKDLLTEEIALKTDINHLDKAAAATPTHSDLNVIKHDVQAMLHDLHGPAVTTTTQVTTFLQHLHQFEVDFVGIFPLPELA